MAYCNNCGTRIQDGVRFCPSCGATVDGETEQQAGQRSDFTSRVAGLNNTADTTSKYDTRDINENKFMAILAYLGLLWLIPFFVKKDSKFVRYHCRQGLNLLILEVAYTILSSILSAIIKTPHYIYGIYYGSYTPFWLSTVLWVISIPLAVLAIIGIVNVARGKAKELPIIGKFRIIK